MSGHIGGHAVVLGGSVAGLLAARVLSEAYRTVTIVERDETDGVATPRRGVPQGRHTHGVLARGQQIFDELFPGYTGELTAAGVRAGDLGSDIRWYFNGRRLRPAPTGLLVVGGDRAVIEHHIRERVRAIGNVEFRTGHDVVTPVTTADRKRVTGVRVQRRAPGAVAEVIEADLVVDATGRGSRTPAWLTANGYPTPGEDFVKVGLSYTSRRYRLRTDAFGTDVSINPVATPDHPRGGFLTSLGGDRAILSLTGLLGDQPPTDPDGFLAYAASLPVPDIHDAIRDAEPLDDPVTFRYPRSVRYRYEKLASFPEHLLVIGDAVCSFNPVYGQGMTVAALQALVLREQLRTGAPPRPDRFFTAISRVLDAPWEISAGGDLAFPGVEGHRTLKVRLGNSFMTRLHAAATHDAGITEAFIRVAGLVDPPERLMRPATVLRVLRGARRAAARPAGTRPDEPDATLPKAA
jgi:2-polyprenyl-6-methoxyphenol hydroxylase-like FAD-dependent oxidoreductase